jgi:hypothetical protein
MNHKLQKHITTDNSTILGSFFVLFYYTTEQKKRIQIKIVFIFERQDNISFTVNPRL